MLRVVAADLLAPALRPLGRGLLAIFTLHRFTDPEYGVVGHDAAALRDHLAYLRRHRYRLLSLTDVLKLIEEGDSDSRTPAVAFTVGDGYAGFARIAAAGIRADQLGRCASNRKARRHVRSSLGHSSDSTSRHR